jgi:hypothetical protein
MSKNSLENNFKLLAKIILRKAIVQGEKIFLRQCYSSGLRAKVFWRQGYSSGVKSDNSF